jgi:hypothetical protein
MSSGDLSGAFFYPACGTDLEPLLRFSHLCDTFVYADWNMSLSDVVESFRATIRVGRSGSRLELTEESDVPPHALIGDRTGAWDAAEAGWPSGFRLTAAEEQSYRRRMGQVSAPRRPWAHEFRFRRVAGPADRALRLIYVAGEGLATYCALFAARRRAPAFVCTIQSGPGFGFGWARLEEPGGTFERFLSAVDPLPRVWIRGNWNRLRGIEGGRWRVPVQEYEGWSARAYAREEDPPMEGGGLVVIRGGGRDVSLDPTPLRPEDLTGHDAAFLTPRIMRRLDLPARDTVIPWAEADVSLPDCLERVADVCGRRGFRRVVMTPRGHEDEGEALREWAGRPGLPERLEVRFVGALDFADLRSSSRRSELDEVYRATAFRVDAPGGAFCLRDGQLSVAVDRMLADHQMSSWAYVTACNPGSSPLSGARNDERMRRLEAEVREVGYRFHRGEGIGALGDWPPEPSLLILGIDEDLARALARRYGQSAILFGRRGEPARLLWIDAPAR